MPISQRQENVRHSISSKTGRPMLGFADLHQMLIMFVYNDQELDIIEKNIQMALDIRLNKKKDKADWKKKVQSYVERENK